MRTLDKIREAVNVECDRQKVGERERKNLFDTYMVHFFNHDMEMTIPRLRELAFQIEQNNGGRFRTTPVTFGEIVGGVDPSVISAAMNQWVKHFNNAVHELEMYTANFKLCDQVVKSFLDIHPFSDGNGRTAWLLRVWLLDQWDFPQPLPNYYGEGIDTRE